MFVLILFYIAIVKSNKYTSVMTIYLRFVDARITKIFHDFLLNENEIRSIEYIL